MKGKLFGEVAIEKGYVRPEQVEAALEEQDRMVREENRYLFLGELFVRQGLMSEKEVLDVLAAIHEKHSST